MDKKQYVLRMLDTLQSIWPLARGLKLLIEAKPLDVMVIDLLITTFTETIKTIDDIQQKESLQKATNFLEKVKEQEIKSREQDQKDINELEAMLSTI
jgi:hypothetical protein